MAFSPAIDRLKRLGNLDFPFYTRVYFMRYSGAGPVYGTVIPHPSWYDHRQDVTQYRTSVKTDDGKIWTVFTYRLHKVAPKDCV